MWIRNSPDESEREQEREAETERSREREGDRQTRETEGEGGGLYTILWVNVTVDIVNCYLIMQIMAYPNRHETYGNVIRAVIFHCLISGLISVYIMCVRVNSV